MKQLFFGGDILTMEQAPYTRYVYVEDGTVRAVDSLAEWLGKGVDVQRVNLEGATLMPAFVDAHSHLSQMAAGELQADLSKTGDMAEMGRRIAAYIEENNIPADQWVIAGGFDLTGTRQGKPSLDQLDQMAMGRPLLIQHAAGHSGYVNTPGLERLGITPETPSPSGGRIEKENGALTGYLEENGYLDYLSKIPLPGPGQMLTAYQKAQQRYASFGITTVQEGLMVPEMLPLYQALLGENRLALDVVAYPNMAAYPAAKAAFPMSEVGYDRHMRLGGLKVILDGSPQARTAWMRAPYAGEQDYRGYAAMEDQTLMENLRFAGENGLQVLAHCNGDAAAEQFIRCMERAEQAYPILKERRAVLIHGQLLGRDQLGTLKALGIIPSFFIAHIGRFGDVHVQNFGPERGCHICSAGSALKSGLTVTFHQDAPVLPPDMLDTVACAVLRTAPSGQVLAPEERISVEAALKAVTINAAYQYHEETKKGSIAPGKAADFAVLSENPLKVKAERLRDIRILQTIRAGETVYRQV